jgi:hypothetical protein
MRSNTGQQPPDSGALLLRDRKSSHKTDSHWRAKSQAAKEICAWKPMNGAEKKNQREKGQTLPVAKSDLARET